MEGIAHQAKHSQRIGLKLLRLCDQGLHLIHLRRHGVVNPHPRLHCLRHLPGLAMHRFGQQREQRVSAATKK